MQDLKSYLTKEGWKKDYEETNFNPFATILNPGLNRFSVAEKDIKDYLTGATKSVLRGAILGATIDSLFAIQGINSHLQMTCIGITLDMAQYGMRSLGLHSMKKRNEEEYQEHKSNYMHLFIRCWEKAKKPKHLNTT